MDLVTTGTWTLKEGDAEADEVDVVVGVAEVVVATVTAMTPLWRVEDLVADSEALLSMTPLPLTTMQISHHWAKIDQSPAGWSLGSLLKLDYLVREREKDVAVLNIRSLKKSFHT